MSIAAKVSQNFHQNQKGNLIFKSSFSRIMMKLGGQAGTSSKIEREMVLKLCMFLNENVLN